MNNNNDGLEDGLRLGNSGARNSGARNSGARNLGLARNREAEIRQEADGNGDVGLEIRPEPLHTLPNGTETVDVIGSKRKYSRAFASDSYDTARYGQHIGENFFATNYGHGVYISDVARILSTFAARNPIPGGAMYNENEVLEWREFYRENRNLFNV
ncbi:hypothetical protein EBX93_09455 [bacterium]|nr:hypothetical protein [bacterium]